MADPISTGPITTGAFSVSLAVQDLARSRSFYEVLGFAVTGGSDDEDYLIMRNPEGHLLGLFRGMFEDNILTFNPGLAQDMSEVEDFTDVRAIEQRLRDAGIEIAAGVESDEGPGHLVVVDPDGNQVMFDQFR